MNSLNFFFPLNCIIKTSNDNGQNQMKNELKFDDFSVFNDNEFFFNEDIDSADYSEFEL